MSVARSTILNQPSCLFDVRSSNPGSTVNCRVQDLNPKWVEVLEEVGRRPGQSAAKRFDLVSRVFRLKLAELLTDLKDGVLGKHAGHIYCVEWQKRGLPHAHILLFLAPGDRMVTAEDYDSAVCAELPDVDTQPELHRLVMEMMLHGPCGGHKPTAPCMFEGKCSKRFPKPRQDFTSDDKDGYPIYRRRCQRTYERYGVLIDDRWVVPYNPALLWKYKAHLNVEVCSTLHAVKQGLLTQKGGRTG
jgi:hypothetical protein